MITKLTAIHANNASIPENEFYRHYAKSFLLKTFHDRLIAKGKKTMTAQCACMRKILLIFRSMVIENRPYQQNFLEK